MPDMLCLPDVKAGDLLTYEALRDQAREAVGERKQAQVAEDLEVTPPAVSFALNKTGGRYAALQRRMIEHYTGFRIEDAAPFVAVEKGA